MGYELESDDEKLKQDDLIKEDSDEGFKEQSDENED
jgi:hypothetical protein|tara:strand:- start:827 stop:934 length:108 start_codon:yes stop_codon:yes gene_type:complete